MPAAKPTASARCAASSLPRALPPTPSSPTRLAPPSGAGIPWGCGMPRWAAQELHPQARRGPLACSLPREGAAHGHHREPHLRRDRGGRFGQPRPHPDARRHQPLRRDVGRRQPRPRGRGVRQKRPVPQDHRPRHVGRVAGLHPPGDQAPGPGDGLRRPDPDLPQARCRRRRRHGDGDGRRQGPGAPPRHLRLPLHQPKGRTGHQRQRRGDRPHREGEAAAGGPPARPPPRPRGALPPADRAHQGVGAGPYCGRPSG
jgi:hypothetical protein